MQRVFCSMFSAQKTLLVVFRFLIYRFPFSALKNFKSWSWSFCVAHIKLFAHWETVLLTRIKQVSTESKFFFKRGETNPLLMLTKNVFINSQGRGQSVLIKRVARLRKMLICWTKRFFFFFFLTGIFNAYNQGYD